MLFLKIIAWALFLFCGMLTIGRTWGYMENNNGTAAADLQRTLDDLRGVRRVYNLGRPATITLVTGAFLIASWNVDTLAAMF